MANYDFRSLSPHDFEQLSRDLLQEALGLRLESFSAGPDSGIDLRHTSPSESLIVQCKHFVGSGFASLRRHLERKERAKIERLQPSRYILATSVPLTPKCKDALFALLQPYCHTTGDILGRDDVNGLLAQQPVVEQRHFKLWLTSAPVLERVLHSGIFSDSEAHLDRVRLRLSRYVPNDSFERAKAFLDDTHYCIIAGIPGIGKTTLAEVLLADLVDRQGFKAFRIAHNLSELRQIKNTKSKQVFYFDDFLGKTSLEKLEKNEDQRLIELMNEVTSNPNWRFILTTREYILNIAKRHYEAFAQPSTDFTLCVIRMSDYTKPVRAKILYNHIYFSDLPKEYKLALLDAQGYDEILSHRNYNPRVVQYMTESRHARAVESTFYRREFVDSLNNPARIWDHAFRYQISEASRHLLLVLTTLPHATRLEDLETAFWSFYRYRRERFGFSTTPGDWDDAMRELDGNFIASEKLGDAIIVSFHSPSVRDFMERFLAASGPYVTDLIGGACYYEQYTALWNGVRGHRYRGVNQASAQFLASLASNLYAPSAFVIRRANSQGEVVGVVVDSPSNENRAAFCLRVVDALDITTGPPLVKSMLGGLQELWQKGHADREDLVRLLEMLTERGLRRDDAPFSAARGCILTLPEELAHFRAAISFAEAYPEEVSEGNRNELRSQFREFASEYADGWDDDDPDWLREVATDLESVGGKLDVDTEPFTEGLYERAEEIENERAEPPDDYDEDWRPSRSHAEDVHGMFESLRNDLLDD